MCKRRKLNFSPNTDFSWALFWCRMSAVGEENTWAMSLDPYMNIFHSGWEPHFSCNTSWMCQNNPPPPPPPPPPLYTDLPHIFSRASHLLLPPWQPCHYLPRHVALWPSSPVMMCSVCQCRCMSQVTSRPLWCDHIFLFFFISPEHNFRLSDEISTPWSFPLSPLASILLTGRTEATGRNIC